MVKASTLTPTYLTALGLLALLLLGAFWMARTNIRAERVGAEIINVSGHQRMLSQRLAEYALRLAVTPSAKTRSELETVLGQMAAAHEALLAGTVVPGSPQPPSEAVRRLYEEPPLAVDAQVERYLEHAREVLRAGALDLTNPDLQALLKGSSGLLYALDEVVAQHELEAENDNRLLSMLAGAVLATLTTLALVTFVLFRPMTAAVKRTSEERNKLLETVETALRRTETLYNIADKANQAENPASVLQDLVTETAAALKADRVLLVTVDLAARVVREVTVGGKSAARVPPLEFEELWEGLSGWVLREGETAYSAAGARDPRESDRVAASRQASGSGEVLVAPLGVQGNCFGTLTAVRDVGADPFSADETALITAVANQATVILKSALADAERDRLASEFEAIFKAIPDAVLFADPERRIRLINPAAEAVFGYTQAELGGEATNLLYAEQGDDAARCYNAAEGTSSYEVGYRTRGGGKFLGETVGTAVCSRSGELLGYISIIRDVTEARRAERERTAEGVFLQAVLESVDDGIVACDASGRLTLFNAPPENCTA